MSAEHDVRPGAAAFTARGAVLCLGAVALAVAGAAALRRPPARPVGDTPAPVALPTRLQPESLSEVEAAHEAVPVSGAYRRPVERPRPVQNVAASEAPEAVAAPQPSGGPASRRRDEKRTLPEIFRMPAEAPGAQAPAAPPLPAGTPGAGRELAEGFAPFGRLLKCELLETLDSVTARSEPIAALVTEDLDWNGRVIVPAGTEAFGYARPEPIIESSGVGRLVDTGEWTLVLPSGEGGDNGREMALRARVLDRRETLVSERGGAEAWGVDDGAPGLIGYAVSTLDRAQIRLFAAAALSGMAEGAAAIAERQQPAPGLSGALGATQLAPTLANAATASTAAGTVAVLNQYAERIRQEIQSRGAYVRVPAGKDFYLFVEQTIDPRAAAVGLRLPREKGGLP